MPETTSSSGITLWPDLEGLHLAIKRASALDIKECSLSREQLAHCLGSILRRNITLAQLDSITSETHAHRFPADWVPAWTLLTGSRRVFDLLVVAAGLWIGDAHDRMLADYGQTCIDSEALNEHSEALRKKLRGLP